MKKKLLKVFSLVFVLLLMSGCVKYHANIKVTNDKKMNMELLVAVSKNLQDQSSTTSTDDDDESIEKLKQQGWKVEEYEDTDYKGSKLSKTYNDIDDISTNSQVEYDLNSLVEEGKESKYMFYKKTENGKTVYSAKFKANTDSSTISGNTTTQDDSLTEEEKEQQEQLEAMTKQMLSSMDLKMFVEVPNVISSNATTVEGNKLTWDLTKLTDNSYIEFEFSLDESSNTSSNNNSSFLNGNKEDEEGIVSTGPSFPLIPLIIGGLAFLFLIIIVVVVLLLTRKKNTKPVEPVTNPVVSVPLPEITPTVGEVKEVSTPVEVPTTEEVKEVPAPVEVPTTEEVKEVPAPVKVPTTEEVKEVPVPVEVPTTEEVKEVPAPVEDNNKDNNAEII